MRPVAVTGAGVICAGGNSTSEFLDTLRAGKTKIAPVPHSKLQPFPNRFAGLVDLSDAEIASSLGLSPGSFDRYTLLALRAAEEAISSAGLSREDCRRAALIAGTCSYNV